MAKKQVEGQEGMFEYFLMESSYKCCANYDEFCTNYKISLNPQQAEAVQTVHGPVLLLAVPGSGKTTVLITRIGYMITCIGIDPENILAMTYTREATADMNKRFEKLFGKELAAKMQFRTINGVADRVVRKHGAKVGIGGYKLLAENSGKQRILSRLIHEERGEYPTDSEVNEIELFISRVKNLMLSEAELERYPQPRPDAKRLYYKYIDYMTSSRQMDFDDQMVYCYKIFCEHPEVLEEMQRLYQYICVDEAQDTSKIQHMLIQKLAGEQANLFMVGDEDQSIYAFRAAYPAALLKFQEVYPDGIVLLMEQNYRSSATIVDVANAFIKKNPDRYDKKMITSKSAGLPIEKIYVRDRDEQYERMFNIVKEGVRDTAILFRSNDSFVPLANLLLKYKLNFTAKNTGDSFFTHPVVVDVLAFLRLSRNHFDETAFKRIYYKTKYPMNKTMAEQVIDICRNEHKTIFSAIASLKVEGEQKRRMDDLSYLLEKLTIITDVEDAIGYIYKVLGYSQYMESKDFSEHKIHLLKILARQEGGVQSFLIRMCDLERELSKPKKGNKNLTLSTIHSSKGLEFNKVYLIDVYDGCFPQTSADSDDPMELAEHMEERRLFYVALTRAKKQLSIFTLMTEDSTFSETITAS